MATVTKSQGKTGFVKEFLSQHPDGTTKTVNEAWQAAGFDGTISHPIISDVRKQLGLTGNLPGKTMKAAKDKSAPILPKTAIRDQDKTSFVKQFLSGNPQGNVQAVNEAWTAAGNEGSIGATLIQKLRSEMGLTGNLRATSKPKTLTVTPGKTSFVKEFLQSNPQANSKDVNEAWQAAGFEGTISPTLVNKTRVKMTGKRRGKARTTAKKPETIVATPGKTMFVKEFLNDHPEGNYNDVNEAWAAAGFEGTISRTLVDKMRALLWLTGNLRGKTKTTTTFTGKKLGRPRKELTAVGNGQPRGRNSNRTLALNELEADIDRLIFKVMGIGDLTEIEDSLRQARRVLYGALTRG